MASPNPDCDDDRPTPLIPSQGTACAAPQPIDPERSAPGSDAPPPRRLFIETVGCQMNVLDSELVVERLRRDGYELTSDPQQADTILFNTCSVRQHAEDKVYSALGRLRGLKAEHPEVTIGVLGCMAQKDQKRILQRAPHVDLMVGPGQLEVVPELIARAKNGERKLTAFSLPRTAGSRDRVAASFNEFDPARRKEARKVPFQAFVRIMMGCDKFCTYCIVPSVRGPEQSRHPDEIVEEVRNLVDQGTREVTLLGQTVNSYRHKTPDGRITSFSDLLAKLHDIDGLRRIKFVTNYPNDMTDELLAAIRDLPRISRYLHVPAQSGCDQVLKRMKRGYTVGLYNDMMARIRETLPEAAVTSDFIVGFCGETEASFQKTVDLVRRWRFKNSFIFKYSPREGTKAYNLFPDDVPEAVKRRRNNELLAVQNAIALEDQQAFVGRTVEILVEGPSKAHLKAAGGPGAVFNGSASPAIVFRSIPSSASSHGSGVPDPDFGAEPAQDVASPTLLTEPHPPIPIVSGAKDEGGSSRPSALVSLAPPPRPHLVALPTPPDRESEEDRPLQLTGRTACDRIVVFEGHPRLIGSFLPVTIQAASAVTLFGQAVTREGVVAQAGAWEPESAESNDRSSRSKELGRLA